MRIVQDAAVAVDVLDVEPVDGLLVERIAAGRRTDVPRPVGQRELGAVGVQARAEVDDARVEEPRDVRIVAVAGHERCRKYSTAVDAVSSAAWMLPSAQNAGLSTSATGRGVGDRRDPDVAAFVALADRSHRDQRGARGGVVVQQSGQFVVSEKRSKLGTGGAAVIETGGVGEGTSGEKRAARAWPVSRIGPAMRCRRGGRRITVARSVLRGWRSARAVHRANPHCPMTRAVRENARSAATRRRCGRTARRPVLRR